MKFSGLVYSHWRPASTQTTERSIKGKVDRCLKNHSIAKPPATQQAYKVCVKDVSMALPNQKVECQHPLATRAVVQLSGALNEQIALRVI
jgi:hypothetical protein